MKNNHGITLVVLIVTVIIMLILASTAVYTGLNSIEQSKIVAFISEMRIVQSQVNYIYEKISQGDTSYAGKGQEIASLPSETLTKIQTAITAVNLECAIKEETQKVVTNYRYFSINNLKDLGIKDATMDVIIDFQNRSVISTKGVKYEDKLYYRHFDLGEGQNVEYTPPTEAPTFSLEKKIYGLNAKMTITDLKYAQNVANGSIYYSKQEEENWLKVQGTEININETGNYKVKVVDSIGNTSQIQTMNITLVNSPKLSQGMVPVIWDNEHQAWKVTDANNGTWYDYEEQTTTTENGGTARWANVMLEDDLETDANGYVTTMGSMFVWIPRYTYNIKSGWHTSTAGEIDVKFLKGTSSVPTDNKNITITVNSGQGNWLIPQAFVNGNGGIGWDKELTGFWAGKFESSSENGLQGSSGNRIKIIPDVNSWRSITVSTIFTHCRAMSTTNYATYGFISSAEVDTHMMKNIEWGAVAYLANSKYGRNGTQVTVNNNRDYMTGYGGNTISSSDAANTGIAENQWTGEKGKLASTTGNIYGVYDLSGGAWEYVAGYVNNANINSSGLCTNLVNAENKYKDVYQIGTTDTGPNNYNANASRYGDAVYETSTDVEPNNSWNLDYLGFPETGSAMFIRGGYYFSGGLAGIFATSRLTGFANTPYGFRPVLVCNP